MSVITAVPSICPESSPPSLPPIPAVPATSTHNPTFQRNTTVRPMSNVLSPLLDAEAEATKQVQMAEQQARQKVQQAELDAEREYQKLKKDEEAKFNQEQAQTANKGDATVQAVVEKIAVQKKQQEEQFKKNEESVIQLILHQVTSADIKLSEQQRQAFLAIKRAKDQANAEPAPY